MRRVIPVLLLVLGLTGHGIGQQSISGTITSADGNPLGGASVELPPGQEAAVSDRDGTFTLTVPEGTKRIYVRRPGFQKRTIRLDSTHTYQIALEAEPRPEEPVVTALGILRDPYSLTFDVPRVKGGKVAAAQELNSIAALTGRVAGLRVINDNSGQGGSAHLLLRANTSFTADQQPLFVVDGIPFANDNNNDPSTVVAAGGRDFGTTIMDLNPADIAAISVLRGGAAAALYGMRAANGVVLITTRSGREGAGFGVAVTSGLSVSEVALLPEYQNQYGGGDSQEFSTFTYRPGVHPATWSAFDGQPMPQYRSDQSWGPEMTGQPVRHWDSWYPGAEFGKLRPWSPRPDNVRNFYTTGIAINNTVAISGGGKSRSYRLSASNNSNSGVYPGFRLNRNTVHANVTQRIGRRLSASLRGGLAHVGGQGRPAIGLGSFGDPVNVQTNFNQWFQRQLDIDRLRDYQGEEQNSYKTWNLYTPHKPSAVYWESPFWSIDNNQSTEKRNRGYGNLSLEYQVLQGLTVTGSVNTDRYHFSVDDQIATYSTAHIGYRQMIRVDRSNDNFSLRVDYTTDLKHNLALRAGLGGNLRMDRYTSERRKVNPEMDLTGVDTINLWYIDSMRTDLVQNVDMQSVYGYAGIGWRNTLFLDASLRNDRTSALEAGYNSHLSPALSASFVFSELLDSRLLTYGKLRTSVARVASDPVPYRTRQSYLATQEYDGLYGAGLPALQANAGLLTETVSTTELGLDLGFFRDRIGLGLTYYTINSRDLVHTQPLSGASGYSFITVNGGEMQNQGVEVALSLVPVRTASVSWRTRLSLAMNRNTVTSLGGEQAAIELDGYGVQFVAAPGMPYGTLVGTGYQRDAAGNVLVDGSGFPLIEEGVAFGSAFPDLTGGLVNQWQYRNFNLGTLIDFRRGGAVYSLSNRNGSYTGQLSNTVGTNENGMDVRSPVEAGGGILVAGVNEDGTPNTSYVDAREYFTHLLDIDEAYVYDGSFVKLREVTVGYQLPEVWFKQSFIDGVRVNLYARNVAILQKNTPNIDPEAAITNTNVQGFENGQNPTVRTVGLQAHIEF
ncbi:SusC/RagA family TonB-linked outer membrane protein [Lewinella sp. IMCC34183]|uniref:SusC/RagA family TonB-linked outer membrane protein n=1 Tax=Lewinella sp. IMCC34183 TaxID=2248762 RepID=UPI000E2680AB|nr:SusC/RagA family TonB-linked outer membrane protein [Lewinella sp. IMCC34183]